MEKIDTMKTFRKALRQSDERPMVKIYLTTASFMPYWQDQFSRILVSAAQEAKLMTSDGAMAATDSPEAANLNLQQLIELFITLIPLLKKLFGI